MNLASNGSLRKICSTVAIATVCALACGNEQSSGETEEPSSNEQADCEQADCETDTAEASTETAPDSGEDEGDATEASNAEGPGATDGDPTETATSSPSLGPVASIEPEEMPSSVASEATDSTSGPDDTAQSLGTEGGDTSAGGSNDPGMGNPPDVEPPVNDGTPLTAEEFCNRRAHLDDAWCEYRDRCCTVEDIESGAFGLPGCMVQDLTEQICNEEITEALVDGLTFDGSWAGACLNELAPFEQAVPLECAGTWGDEAYVLQHNVPEMWALPACQRMLTANVPEGEPCNNVRACAPGLGCGPSTSPDGETFLCHARGGEGSPCYSVNECEVGLACYPFDNGTCRPPSPTNGPCDSIDDCEEGNMCHLDYCAPILTEGQSCPNYTFCLSELNCDFNTAICTAALADGEGPCSSDYDCEGRCDMATSTCTSICGGTR